MSNDRINKLVIVGGGSSGWMSASYFDYLFNHKKHSVDIVLIESADIASVGVGEATIHSMRFFLQTIGISEAEVMKATNATLKHGILFKNWRRQENSEYYHPFEHPNYGDGDSITNHWVNLYGTAEPRPRFDYSVSPQSRFATEHKSPKAKNSKEFEGYFPYGYHLDAIKFASFLRQRCISNGVTRIEDHVDDVSLDENNNIEAVTLKSGGSVSGDFFIDCTGFAAILMEAIDNNEYIDYSEHLLCNRAVTCQIIHDKNKGSLRPFTTATAQKSGWIWDIDLVNRSGFGYVYADKFCSQEEAQETLKEYLNINDNEAVFKHLKMKVGRRKNAWKNNCVAIGLSAGFLEPLESTGLYFIDMALRFLGEYVIAKHTSTAIVDQYNHIMGQLVDQTRDFIVLHYTLSDRVDSPFWKTYKEHIDPPQTLKNSLALWQNKVPSTSDFGGQITQFTHVNYTYILYGMGFTHANPPVNSLYIEQSRSKKNLTVIEQQSLRVMNTIPTLNEYLRAMP